MRTVQNSFEPPQKKKSRINSLTYLAAITLVIATPVLSGCGFHPMDAYKHDSRQNVQLSTIYVAPIPDRDGQIMRFEIKKALNPQGISATTAYSLNVTYANNTSSQGMRRDDSASLVDVVINADFTLTDRQSHRVLLVGQSSASTRKNNSDALYAAYVSEESASKNSARLVAKDIARQVSLFFKYPSRYPLPKIKKPAPKHPNKVIRPRRPN